MLRVLSSLVLTASKDRDCTATLSTCSATCLHGAKVSPYVRSDSLISIYACCRSPFHNTVPCIAWLHPLNNLLPGTGGLLFVPPQSHLFSRLSKPKPLNLSSQGKWWWPLLKSLWFLVPGSPKQDVVRGCDLASAE